MPGASSMRGVTGFRALDAINGALAQLIPTRVAAAGEGGNTLAVFGADAARTAASRFIFYELIVGTWGGTPLADGNDGVTNPASLAANIPVEVAESEFPILIERYGLVPDSGGAGRHRGGLAVERVWRCLTPETSLIVRSDRAAHPPYGLQGGAPGALSSNVLLQPDGIGGASAVDVLDHDRRGRRLRPSHGGRRRLGRSARARPAAIAEDVADGKVDARPAARGSVYRAGVDADHVRGDPQRARRRDRRDGGRAAPQRVLDQHQDALRLLVRVLRRRAALGRAGVRAARAPRLDGRADPARGPRLRRPRTSAPATSIVTNDPFPSGVHLNDVSLISPVFYDGELLGYVANLAHHVDVGGGAPASIGAFREVFQEGVIIPPVKIVEAGRIVPDVFALILAQIRSKHETGGDLRAQIAANKTGVRRLQALVERHGRDTIARHDGRAARLHRAPHARRARGAPARQRTRPRARRHRRLHRRAGPAEGGASSSAPTACASTPPAPTRSAARRSTRPTRRRSRRARTR